MTEEDENATKWEWMSLKTTFLTKSVSKIIILYQLHYISNYPNWNTF